GGSVSDSHIPFAVSPPSGWRMAPTASNAALSPRSDLMIFIVNTRLSRPERRAPCCGSGDRRNVQLSCQNVLLSPTRLSRRFPECGPEGPHEGGEVFIPAGQSDIAHGHAGMEQQIARPFHPGPPEIFRRADVELG